MRRAIVEKQTRQYFNAFKYFLLMMADFAYLYVTNYDFNEAFYIWVTVKTIA